MAGKAEGEAKKPVLFRWGATSLGGLSTRAARKSLNFLGESITKKVSKTFGRHE